MTPPSLRDYLNFAVETAWQAGRITLGYFQRELSVAFKSDDTPVTAAVPGVVRGLIRDGRRVIGGLKIGDVDPAGDRRRAFTISEKSNAIAGGVLEAVLAWRAGRSTTPADPRGTP